MSTKNVTASYTGRRTAARDDTKTLEMTTMNLVFKNWNVYLLPIAAVYGYGISFKAKCIS